MVSRGERCDIERGVEKRKGEGEREREKMYARERIRKRWKEREGRIMRPR